MSNLRELSPDHFLRYFFSFKIIKSLQGSKPCNILDLGGRKGILGNFIRKEKLPYHLTIIDALPDEDKNPTICNKYVTGDFTKLNKQKFDFIVSLDVLEHIEDKEKFISGIVKIGKTIILSAPFESKEVLAAEKTANNFFKKFTGQNHPWLQEHFNCHLPEQEWLEAFLKNKKYNFQKIPTNNLNNWISFMLVNFFPTFVETKKGEIQKLNRFYNKNYQKLNDSNPPVYRSLYVISKNKISIPDKITENKSDPVKQFRFNKKMIEFFGDSLNSSKIRIMELEKKLNEKESQLNTITSARTFKIWQLFNKIRKNPKLILRIIKIFLFSGIGGISEKLKQIEERESLSSKINDQLQLWIKNNFPSSEELNNQKKEQLKFKYRPKISIITPVYNTDRKWLEPCISSVLNQTYDNWELCLADDCSTKPYIKDILEKFSGLDKRIKVVFRKENGHISRASNSALKIATGQFIALLDHDDELPPHALFKVVQNINKNPEADFLYSDEDKLDLNGRHVDPFFKPDWSPDFLFSTNYICHFTVIRKNIIDKIGGFRTGFEGSQDFDLFLRATEKAKKIVHIPDILYHWRKIPGSTAEIYSIKNYANEASIKVLKDTLKRRKIKGEVFNGLVEGHFRVKYEIVGNPAVSIIIPTKDKIEYLKKCINSILSKTSYKNYEILVVDTGSTEKAVFDFYHKLSVYPQIKVLNWKEKFNYSSVNNFAVKKAKGKYIVLLNNDTEIITPDWIESMLEHTQRKEVGAVGVKLLYPDNRIQHAGVILGIMGVANHASLNMNDRICQVFPVPNSKDTVRNFSAVTAACLMISKEKYLEVGGFDKNFRIAFNDVDFCLKLRQKNYFNVYTPFVKVFHYESISVGKPDQGTRDIEEFQNEVKMMLNKWGKLLKHDPFYNPNLTLKDFSFNLNVEISKGN